MSNTASPVTILSPTLTEKTNLKELCSKIFQHPQFKWIIIFLLVIVGLYFYLVVNKTAKSNPFKNKELKIRKLDKELLLDTDDDTDSEQSNSQEPVMEQHIEPVMEPLVEHHDNVQRVENNTIDELLDSEEDLNIRNEDLTTEEMNRIDAELEHI